MTASLGGLDALSQVLGVLPSNFPLPILVVQHLSARFPSDLVELLGPRTALTVTWAQPGRLLRPGVVYVAPPDQHLLVSIARSLRLSQRPHVQVVRPSADVLVESVAASYRERAIATGPVDFVLPLPIIAPALVALTMAPGAAALFDRPTRVPALLPA